METPCRNNALSWPRGMGSRDWHSWDGDSNAPFLVVNRKLFLPSMTRRKSQSSMRLGEPLASARDDRAGFFPFSPAQHSSERVISTIEGLALARRHEWMAAAQRGALVGMERVVTDRWRRVRT